MKNKDFLYKTVEDKTIVWFETSNQYLILEHTSANILERLSSGAAANEIAESLTKKLSIPFKESINFVLELKKKFFKEDNSEKLERSNNSKYTERPKDFKFIKYYKINDVVFKISFLNDKELSLVHPKFVHLVIDEVTDFNSEFEVFINHNYIFLYVNNVFIGSWDN